MVVFLALGVLGLYRMQHQMTGKQQEGTMIEKALLPQKNQAVMLYMASMFGVMVLSMSIPSQAQSGLLNVLCMIIGGLVGIMLTKGKRLRHYLQVGTTVFVFIVIGLSVVRTLDYSSFILSGVALLAAFVLLPLCYALSVDARPDKLNAITGFSAMAVVGGSLVGWAICHSCSSATSLVIFMMGIATLFYSAFCVDANVAKY